MTTKFVNDLSITFSRIINPSSSAPHSNILDDPLPSWIHPFPGNCPNLWTLSSYTHFIPACLFCSYSQSVRMPAGIMLTSNGAHSDKVHAVLSGHWWILSPHFNMTWWLAWCGEFKRVVKYLWIFLYSAKGCNMWHMIMCDHVQKLFGHLVMLTHAQQESFRVRAESPIRDKWKVM